MIPEYDKYAPYIWACYGITLVVLVLVLWWTLARSARVKAELESLDGARRRAKADVK